MLITHRAKMSFGIGIAALMVLVSTSVGAQQPVSLGDQPEPLGADMPDRPFRGLFQQRPRTVVGGQSLTVDASAYGAYDNDVAAGLTGAIEPRSSVGGFY